MWLIALPFIMFFAYYPVVWSLLDSRLIIATTALAGMAAFIATMFVLLEIRAKRIYDPVALSKLLELDVYTLPTLPKMQSTPGSAADAAYAQIERMVQKLDHVRFAYCRKSAAPESAPCLLITSAVDGEGKSTLAASLARRCGFGGMQTLLIDADVGRGCLRFLFDLPEGIGLTDLLKEEATIDEVTIPVADGRFFLIGAGTPVYDIIGLLQDKKTELLIDKLRQTYDLIIIDSPPLVTRPDALILCEQVDVVILTARHGYSRYPLVAQAKRMLAATGVPSIGAVLAGYR